MLKLGAVLRLIDPEEPVIAARPECERVRWQKPPARPCGHCEHCIGLPENSEHPLSTVRVVGFMGDDTELDPREPVIAPVAFSNLSSPRRVSAEVLLSLYEIVEPGEDAGEWVTAPEGLIA